MSFSAQQKLSEGFALREEATKTLETGIKDYYSQIVSAPLDMVLSVLNEESTPIISHYEFSRAIGEAEIRASVIEDDIERRRKLSEASQALELLEDKSEKFPASLDGFYQEFIENEVNATLN